MTVAMICCLPNLGFGGTSGEEAPGHGVRHGFRTGETVRIISNPYAIVQTSAQIREQRLAVEPGRVAILHCASLGKPTARGSDPHSGGTTRIEFTDERDDRLECASIVIARCRNPQRAGNCAIRRQENSMNLRAAEINADTHASRQWRVL